MQIKIFLVYCLYDKHVFAYFPDGFVQVKEHICSWQYCLLDNRTSSEIEKGQEIGNDTADNNKSYIEFEFEENMISSDNIFNVVLVDSVKALYSPSNAQLIANKVILALPCQNISLKNNFGFLIKLFTKIVTLG